MQSYVPIRGKRLVLGSEAVAQRLVVHDFKIGFNGQFFNCCPLFGGCFSDVAFPFRLRLDTAQTSQTLRLCLENVSEEDVTVSPTLFGVAVL